MVLDMDVELPNGDFLPLKILVDTGAQVNLVRRDLVPRQDWRPAPNPVRLITQIIPFLGVGTRSLSWV